MARQYSLAAPNLQHLLDVFIGQEEQPHFKKIQNLLYQCEKNVFGLEKVQKCHFNTIHDILNKFDSLEYDVTSDAVFLIKAVNDGHMLGQLQALFV